MDYKEKYIELNKALTDLKRKKTSNKTLELLGYSISDFNEANEWLVLNEYTEKERALFIKTLKKYGMDLFEVYVQKYNLMRIFREIERDERIA